MSAVVWSVLVGPDGLSSPGVHELDADARARACEADAACDERADAQLLPDAARRVRLPGVTRDGDAAHQPE